MRYILSILGIIGSMYMIRYRERIGDMIGEPDWLHKFGGVYNLVIIIAVIIFFWSVAELTGTTGVLFEPLLYVLPGPKYQQTGTDMMNL